MLRKRAAGRHLVLNDMDAKYSSLMQDYRQLQDEFAALNNRLQADRIRKARVYAEVRFLRRRLKTLKETLSHLKGKETSSPIVPCDFSTAYNGKSAPETSTQSPNNNSLVTTEITVFPDLLRANGSGEFMMLKPVIENDGLASALKTSAFRNSPNVFITKMPGKRKISWQDQISLECN